MGRLFTGYAGLGLRLESSVWDVYSQDMQGKG